MLFKVSNEQAGFQLQIRINKDINALLFKSKEDLQYSNQYIELLPNVENQIKKEEDLYLPFQALSNFLNRKPDELLYLFLIMLAREDKRAYKLLCTSWKPIFMKKKDFIKLFRSFLAFNSPPRIKNPVTPDFLMNLVCHCYYYDTNGKTDIEIPDEIVPFVLNIVGVIPDEKRLRMPNLQDTSKLNEASFDVTVEPRVENEPEKQNFLSKLFSSLKPH